MADSFERDNLGFFLLELSFQRPVGIRPTFAEVANGSLLAGGGLAIGLPQNSDLALQIFNHSLQFGYFAFRVADHSSKGAVLGLQTTSLGSNCCKLGIHLELRLLRRYSSPVLVSVSTPRKQSLVW